jgi:hypothetical protein
VKADETKRFLIVPKHLGWHMHALMMLEQQAAAGLLWRAVSWLRAKRLRFLNTTAVATFE